MSVPVAAKLSPGEIARASGSNFLISFAFLSPGRRRALLAVYAFCRVVDDAVDLADRDEAQARTHLEFWENELDAAFADDPTTRLGFALSRAASKFALDKEPLVEVCRGVRMDLTPRLYETFDDLRIYMLRVASAVGITCLPIFGADRERSRDYANHLGVALQFTNILRDIAEDGDGGRCYLPQSDLREFGVDPSWLTSQPPTEALADDGPVAKMLERQHERAESLFRAAEACLPAADRRALRPARIMSSIYRDLRRRTERLGAGVLAAPRVRVPIWRKAYLATLGI